MTKLQRLLVLHEGMILHRYKCPAGKVTIGVGHNLEARPLDLPETITEQQALAILEDDIEDVRQELIHALPWVASMDEVRQAVLLDMGFNLGVPGLLKWKNTLAAVKTGNWVAASANMGLSKWYSQVGDRAKRLMQMMVSGNWPQGVA